MSRRPTFAVAILLATLLSSAMVGSLAAQSHDLPPIVQPSSGQVPEPSSEKSPAAEAPAAVESSPPPDAPRPPAAVEEVPTEKRKPPADDAEVAPILEIDPKNPYVARQPEVIKPAPILVREGRRLFDRQGTIVRQGNESLFVFDSGEPPMVLAACKPLERTENFSEFGKRPLKFYVSGEVTEYRGRNYLLMTDTPRTTDSADPTGDSSLPPRTGGPSTGAAPPAKTPATGETAPEGQSPPRDRNVPPPPGDVRIPAAPPPPAPPSARPIPPSSPYRGQGESGKVAGVPTLLPEDKRLIDCEGRLVREGTLNLFVFDNGDRPVVLVPNRKLERMEQVSDFGRQPVRFRISGRVTEYRGRNHLAMSKMVIIPKAVEKL